MGYNPILMKVLGSHGRKVFIMASCEFPSLGSATPSFHPSPQAVRQRQCRFREAVDACHLGNFFSSDAWFCRWRVGVETHFFVAKMVGTKKNVKFVNQKIVAIFGCCHRSFDKKSEQDLSAFFNSKVK